MGCTKVGYESYKQAMEVVAAGKKCGNKRHAKAKLPQRAYKCNNCEKWHLTSRKKKKSRKVWR